MITISRLRSAALCATLMLGAPLPVLADVPQTGYSVLAGIAHLSAEDMDAQFARILSGADGCAPMAYADHVSGKGMRVTLLAPCLKGGALDLEYGGLSLSASLSQNGAFFITLPEQASGVPVVLRLKDGTVLTLSTGRVAAAV